MRLSRKIMLDNNQGNQQFSPLRYRRIEYLLCNRSARSSSHSNGVAPGFLAAITAITAITAVTARDLL
jgi:hypothetical protein